MKTRQAWVRDAESREAECRRVAGLVGKQLRAVRYLDFGYSGDVSTWVRSEFHAIDYGLELDFADGTTWSFIWQTIRPWEGLLAFEGTLIGNEIVPDSECKTWSIDHIPAWARLIGSAITSVDSGWEDYGEAQSPFAWAIHFEHSNQVVIALGDVDDHYGFTPSADNVAVFFSLDSAHRHGLEPTPPST